TPWPARQGVAARCALDRNRDRAVAHTGRPVVREADRPRAVRGIGVAPVPPSRGPSGGRRADGALHPDRTRLRRGWPPPAGRTRVRRLGPARARRPGRRRVLRAVRLRSRTGVPRRRSPAILVSAAGGRHADLAPPGGPAETRRPAPRGALDVDERPLARPGGQRTGHVPLDLPLAPHPERLRRLLAGGVPPAGDDHPEPPPSRSARLLATPGQPPPRPRSPQ